MSPPELFRRSRQLEEAMSKTVELAVDTARHELASTSWRLLR